MNENLEFRDDSISDVEKIGISIWTHLEFLQENARVRRETASLLFEFNQRFEIIT